MFDWLNPDPDRLLDYSDSPKTKRTGLHADLRSHAHKKKMAAENQLVAVVPWNEMSSSVILAEKLHWRRKNPVDPVNPAPGGGLLGSGSGFAQSNMHKSCGSGWSGSRFTQSNAALVRNIFMDL